MAHYGDAPLVQCTPEWQITASDGKVFQSGKLPVSDLKLGNCIKLGNVTVPLSGLTSPQKVAFSVTV